MLARKKTANRKLKSRRPVEYDRIRKTVALLPNIMAAETLGSMKSELSGDLDFIYLTPHQTI